MTRAMRALLFFLGATVCLSSGVAIGRYSSEGASLSFSEPSPDGRERLDFYHATHWQAFRTRNADMPGFVRLVRLAGDETLGTSPPFEMSGSGQVTWDGERVNVGSTATFDRRTRRWTMDQ